MLTHTVSTNCHRAMLHHILPEVVSSFLISGGSVVQLINALKTNIFRYLRVGMLSIEERSVQRLHILHHRVVAEFLGSSQVFLVTKDFIGICQGFVHTAMLPSQHGLHVGRIQFAHHIHAPIA